MTKDQLHEFLSSSYDIVCLEDLATILSTPYYLYQLLYRVRKSTFSNNERLVFFSNNIIEDSMISYIKQACDRCDISACFILLVCSYDITHLINRVFSTNDKIQILIADVESEKLSKNYLRNDTICALPWMHLHVNNLGEINFCCQNTKKFGSIINDNPSEIFLSEDFQTFRNSLKSGIQESSCDACWKVEASGGTSMRQEMLKWHEEKFFKRLIDQPSLESLDIKLGNTCNFKCRICSETSSSAIAAEKIKYEKNPDKLMILTSKQHKGKWFDANLNSARDKIIPLLNQVTQLDFYGGEPFYSRSLEYLLDHIISIGRASEIRLHLNTNGSIFPTKIIKKLNQFQQIDIGISIDDVGERFEVIRGGSWQGVNDNINLFRQLPNTRYNIYFFVTISILNVYYLNELLEWSDKIGVKILLNFVNFPTYLSIDNLTPAARELVLKKYQGYQDLRLQSVVNRIKSGTGTINDRFVKESKLLDQYRSQDLQKTHYEIALAMGYSV